MLLPRRREREQREFVRCCRKSFRYPTATQAQVLSQCTSAAGRVSKSRKLSRVFCVRVSVTSVRIRCQMPRTRQIEFGGCDATRQCRSRHSPSETCSVQAQLKYINTAAFVSVSVCVCVYILSLHVCVGRRVRACLCVCARVFVCLCVFLLVDAFKRQ